VMWWHVFFVIIECKKGGGNSDQENRDKG